MTTTRKRKQRRQKRQLRALGVPQELQFPAVVTGEWRNIHAEASQPATVEMIAYSGGQLFVAGFKHPVVVDLNGLEINAGTNLLLDHNPKHRVGHPEQIQIRDGRVIASGVLSASTTHRDEVVESARAGFRWHVSIGARVIEATLIRRGESVQVNGRRFDGPVIVANKAKLNEISFVGSGGDEDNQVAIAAQRGDRAMNEFEKWLEAQGIALAELSDEATTQLRAAYDALQASGDNGNNGDDGGGDAGAGASEDEGGEGGGEGEGGEGNNGGDAAAQQTANLAAVYRRQAFVNQHLAEHPELQAQAIEEAWNNDRILLEAMRAERSTGPAVHSRNNQMTQAVLEAGLNVHYHNQTEEQAVEEYGERAVTASRRLLPRNPSLRWMAHSLIRAHGGHVDAGSWGEDIWRQAKAIDYRNFQNRLQAGNDGASLQAAGGFSTISLSGTLSNLANKRLLAGYMMIRAVRDRFCRLVDNNDFKQSNKYRVHMRNFLEEVPATGEIEHTELSEDVYTNQVRTYARMIALTRQMIVNDDLNAFLRLPELMGQAASKTLERAVMTQLIANTGTFFNSAATVAANGHLPNALSGAGSALAPASLQSAEQLFLEQVDREGHPIMLMPAFILTPPALKRPLADLLEKRTINVTNTGSDPELRVESSFQGDFDADYSPWVGANGGISGTDTNWWMFARPAEAAVMEIAFLQGRRRPTIESSDTDFNVLGMQWRIYWDWGIAYEDPRAGVYAPGA